MIGSEDGIVENSDTHDKLCEKLNSEEGELEEGELDDEVDDFQPQTNQNDTETTPPETTDALPLESAITVAKDGGRREKHDTESSKSRSHRRHRSGSRLDSPGELNKDDGEKESHLRVQRHSKRRERHRSKDDSGKKLKSTYIDFDSVQDDHDNSWMCTKRPRHSRESMYDSPSESDENCESDDVMQRVSRNFHSDCQYYGNYYDGIAETEEEENETGPIDHDSEYMDFNGQNLKYMLQDDGLKASFGQYNRLSSIERNRNQLSRKRKLVDTPMEERPACRFFMEGKCVKGSDCPFKHDFVPHKREEVCRFHLSERGCTRKNCVFYHDDWPCRHFHKTGTCAYGDECKFSHAELTDETKHLIFLDPNNEHRSENWKSSNNDSIPASEKKKIPSLLDLEIYPPGMEPKIPSSSYLSEGSYKRQRSSGQPGLLGAGPLNTGGFGPRVLSRMQPMEGNMKGYQSSYGSDLFGSDESNLPHFSHSPDYEPRISMFSEGGSSGDDEPYQRPDDNPNPDALPFGQVVQVSPSNLPPVQQDLYRRMQQQQLHQQQSQQPDSQQNVASINKSAASVQPKEKWYSSDEEVNDAKAAEAAETAAMTVISTASNTPLVEQETLVMQKQQSAQTVPWVTLPTNGTMPSCELMPRGLQSPKETVHLPDTMSLGTRSVQGLVPRPNITPRPEIVPPGMLPQRTMTPLSGIIPQSIGMTLTQSMVPSDIMPGPNVMQRGMAPSVSMMPQRAALPPRNLLGQGVMPPRGLMPPFDALGQGIMPPRGVPPMSDMMQRGMMVLPPSDNMLQATMPPQGGVSSLQYRATMSDVPPHGTLSPGMLQFDGQPPFNLAAQGIASMADFNINYILSIIQNSSLPPPTGTGREIMTNPPANFNLSLEPRTAGIKTDPRLRQIESESASIVSSFLQPPESPDQEIEVNGTGKKIAYSLRPILVENRPGLPLNISTENLATTVDPRLQKYLRMTQSNPSTKSNNCDSGDAVIQGKQLDPRLSQRGTEDARKVDAIEPLLDDNIRAIKSPKPYSLPDIILPNSVQDKSSIGRIKDTNACKAVKDISVQRMTALTLPIIKSSGKTPSNLVELPEALQERNYPKDGLLPRQTGTSSSSITTNTNKKIIDYRNDPRYKKKKTKLVLQDDVTTAAQSHPAKEILSPTLCAPKQDDSDHFEQNHELTEFKATAADSLWSPCTGDFESIHLAETEKQNPAVKEGSSLDQISVSECSVHMSLAFFEGVPVSGNTSDIEPAEELNLKDVFKTIDPTTSPFC